MRLKSHSIAGVFVFLLLGIFAVSSVMLVLFGAQAYRGTIALSEAHNEARIIEAFVRNTVRANEAENLISVRESDGLSVLCIGEGTGEDAYYTYLYAYDGMLCELYTSEDNGFDPENGEVLCPLQTITFRLEGETLIAEATDTLGNTREVCVALKCPQGGNRDE